MNRVIAGFIIAALFVLYGCSGKYDGIENYDQSKGGPPHWLKSVYEKKFIVEERNYVRALGEIHAFLIDEGFEIDYLQCFNDVLDIRIRIMKHNAPFPCVAVSAGKGVPVKSYLQVVVSEVSFNQINGDNRLLFSVNMHGSEDLGRSFSGEIEPILGRFYQSVSGNSIGLLHGN